MLIHFHRRGVSKRIKECLPSNCASTSVGILFRRCIVLQTTIGRLGPKLDAIEMCLEAFVQILQQLLQLLG